MWRAGVGVKLEIKSSSDDDWETDPDFVNDVTEEEQRWGSHTVPGSGRTIAAIDMNRLREEVAEADAYQKKKQLQEGPNPAYGYGGKFGIQKDRMDRSAVGHDYVAPVNKHVSQTDYSAGFGGKFGVQTDRIDKSAVTFDHIEKLQQHASQKDYASGFGGRYGVQKDRQDKSALGWDHKEELKKHESQTDYAVGFGGKYGIQKDRQDKCAVGFDHSEVIPKHHSQIDYSKGFGGKFGIESDRVDKSACSFNEISEEVGTNYKAEKPEIGAVKPSSIREKFENLAKKNELSTQTTKPIAKKISKWEVRSQAAAAQKEIVKTENIDKKSAVNTGVNNKSSSVLSKISSFEGNLLNVEKKTLDSGDNNKPEENNDKPSTDENAQKTLTVEHKEFPDEVELKFAECKQIQENPANENLTVENEIINNDSAEVNLNVESDLDEMGYSAIALYDYQASAEDEISFDPDDVITHIEMIDDGWWRGFCKGQYGLFPANYVQLQIEEKHTTEF